MLKLGNPIPYFFDQGGAPLSGGSVYYGAVSADPEVSPIEVYYDSNLTIPAAQPIRTIGGMAVNGVTPTLLFAAGTDYSMKVLDENGAQILYSPSVFLDSSAFQPVDADLTAIAGQGTTAYGRGLLLLPNQAALQNAIGAIPGYVHTTDFSSGSNLSGSWVRYPDGNGGYVLEQRSTGQHGDNTGAAPVAFPMAFSSATGIIAVASNSADAGTPQAVHATGDYTAAGMTVRSSRFDGTPAGMGTTFSWFATGRG